MGRMQTIYLSDLRMNACARGGWEASQVDDEVPHLTEEVVLVGVPIGCDSTLEEALGYANRRLTTRVCVGIRINNSHSNKVRSSFERWESNSISDELSIV